MSSRRKILKDSRNCGLMKLRQLIDERFSPEDLRILVLSLAEYVARNNIEYKYSVVWGR